MSMYYEKDLFDMFYGEETFYTTPPDPDYYETVKMMSPLKEDPIIAIAKMESEFRKQFPDFHP